MTNNKNLLLCLGSFQLENIESYYVGGCVRDAQLGIPCDDIDICLVGVKDFNRVTEILSFWSDSVAAEKGANFPTWKAKFGDEEFDFALARQEVKSGHTRQAYLLNVEGITIEEDLLRRDLTVNAIAINCMTGEVVDPYNGRKDLMQRIARPVSTAFYDDPLRVIRAARFIANLRLEPTEDLIEYCSNMSNSGISNERVSGELKKLFAFNSSNNSGFFKFLKEVGWLNYYFGQINDSLFLNRMMAIDKKGLSVLEKTTLLCYGLEEQNIVQMLEFIKFMDGDFRKQVVCLLTELEHFKDRSMNRSRACKVIRNLKKNQLTLEHLYSILDNVNIAFEDRYYKNNSTLMFDEILWGNGHIRIVTGDMLMENFGFVQGKELGLKMAQLLELQDQGHLNKNNWTEFC